MLKLPILLILIILPELCLQAQGVKKQKMRYASLTQAGLALGSSKAAYTVQTIQGVGQKDWFAGLGIGIDDYGMPGLPLVAHLQKSFSTKNSKPFVYGQAGIQFPWKKGKWENKVQLDINGADEYDLNNGFMGEFGGGYLFGLGKGRHHAIALSAGYSYKYNSATFRQLAWPPWSSYFPPGGISDYSRYSEERHQFHYRRVVVKLGFMF